MRLWTGVLIVLMTLSVTKAALATERGPVCRLPAVVAEMTRQIRDVDYYSRVNADLVTEQPTTDTRFIRCQVCVENAPYDMPRFGERPIRRCVPHDFEVKILPAGFTVRDLGLSLP